MADSELKFNIEDELSTLLQVDGQGWKVELFENQASISSSICANCRGICRDAAELDCDHNDSDIFLHCDDCLKKLIIENDGKCPITNHSEPIIARNRATRRLIAKSIIFCPYSVQYQNRINPNNADIDDDEKTGCNFKGQIDNLLQNHLSECKLTYSKNVIVNKLKHENEKLKLQNRLSSEKCSDLQSKFSKKTKKLSHEIKKLANNNNELQTKLNQQHSKHIKLRKELSNELLVAKDKIAALQLAAKHNEYIDSDNEEKHVNVRRNVVVTNFWGKCGNYMTIKESIVSFQASFGNNTVYSASPLSAGKHEMKFKVINKDDNCTMYIGIASTTDFVNDLCFGKNKDPCNYAYRSDGYKYSNEYNPKKYATSYSTGDIITTCLDFNNCTISFDKNGMESILVRIRKGRYFVAVTMKGGYGTQGSIEILSYTIK